MNTNDTKRLADTIIKVLDMETGLKKFFGDIERRMAKADRWNDLSIRRLVKLESRAEAFDKKLELSIANQEQMNKNFDQTNWNLEQTNKNLELFGRKLEKSIKDQEASSRRQAEINDHFLKQLRKNGRK